MFCTNCGNQIADGSKFCPSCGSSTSENASAAHATQTAQMTQASRSTTRQRVEGPRHQSTGQYAAPQVSSYSSTSVTYAGKTPLSSGEKAGYFILGFFGDFAGVFIAWLINRKKNNDAVRWSLYGLGAIFVVLLAVVLLGSCANAFMR